MSSEWRSQFYVQRPVPPVLDAFAVEHDRKDSNGKVVGVVRYWVEIEDDQG